MQIKPRWLRDLCSILFSVYYIIYANEADEKVRRLLCSIFHAYAAHLLRQLRKFRAVPTVEMLRATWEKTTNPYVCLICRLPSMNSIAHTQ